MTEAGTVVKPIGSLTLDELFKEIRQNEASIAMIDETAMPFVSALQTLKGEVVTRYGESVKQALDQADKTHGTTTLELQDGFKIKGDVKRTVKWDSAKLMAIAQKLPWERVSAMFKIEFSMPEAIYKGVAALSPEMRKQIDEARTETFAPATAVLSKEA